MEAREGFAKKKVIVTKSTKVTQSMCDMIMNMSISLIKDWNAIIVNAYAPTLANPEKNKQLKGTLRNIHSTDKILLIFQCKDRKIK